MITNLKVENKTQQLAHLDSYATKICVVRFQHDEHGECEAICTLQPTGWTTLPYPYVVATEDSLPHVCMDAARDEIYAACEAA